MKTRVNTPEAWAAAWETLWEARKRHPLLVTYAAVQLRRLFGYGVGPNTVRNEWAMQVLSEMWSVMRHMPVFESVSKPPNEVWREVGLALRDEYAEQERWMNSNVRTLQ